MFAINQRLHDLEKKSTLMADRDQTLTELEMCTKQIDFNIVSKDLKQLIVQFEDYRVSTERRLESSFQDFSIRNQQLELQVNSLQEDLKQVKEIMSDFDDSEQIEQ